MDNSQAIGLALGAGILGSVATYLMLNNNTDDSDVEENNFENSDVSKLKDNVEKEVKKELEQSVWSSFWKKEYDNKKEDDEKKQDDNNEKEES